MKIIGIEEHFTTPLYRQHVSANEFRNFYLDTRSTAIGHNISAENADIGAGRIAHMDADGVDMQVLSFGSPGAEAFEGDTAITMARDANDRMAAAIKQFPGRFAAFAALPVGEPEAAADELERAVTELGFKGTMIHGHTRGRFLDHKDFWVIFERAARLDVPIYLHPTLAHPAALGSYFDGYEELARAGYGFQVDTSCHFLRIVFAGVFDAFPNLKFILGHLGEGLPFAMHRLNDHTWQAAAARGLKRQPIEYLLDNMIVTTSGNWHVPSFLCTMMTLGIDKMLFAVDWPYEPNSTAVAFLKSLPISDEDRAKLAHKNAERLLKL